MSAENIELLKELSEALNSRGVEAVLPYVHPEFETTTPPELASEPGTYRGKEGVKRYFDSFNEAMEGVRFVPEEFIDMGEQVIVRTRLVATGRSTGIEVEQKAAIVWSIKDRLVIGAQAFATLEEAREACESQSPQTSSPA